METFSKRITGPRLAEGVWPIREPASLVWRSQYVSLMWKVLQALLVAMVVTAAVVGGAVLVRSPDKPDADLPAYDAIPLSDYDTVGLVATRDSFCDAVPDEAVTDAVGTEPESATTYGNGDRVRLTDSVNDVAHEFGCKWPATGATARAWVFAPPVTTRSAKELARAARAEPGCETVPDAPRFGKPSTALVCEVGQRLEVSYRGLFGDAWLTCTLSAAAGVPRPELIERAGRFCVAVVEAARTR